MQHPIHPDPERLAALAGGDPEATADGALTGHADTCTQCGEVLRELRLLRSALSELPDLVPSRPLQLVPPVPAETAADGGGPLGWLRRLAAPVMAAGAGLALVGAVGFGSVVLGGMAASAGARPDLAAEDRGGEAPEEASGEPANFDESGEPAPSDEAAVGGPDDPSDGEDAEDGEESAVALVDLATPTPWLVLTGAGALMLVGGLALRFVVQPRAG